MVIKLVLEVVLGIITLLAGSFFWQVHKHGRFLVRAIHDGPLLSQLISPSALDNPPPIVALFIQRLPPGYVLNIQVVNSADRQTQRNLKILFGSVAAAALVGSYWLGVPYLVINAFVFFFSAFARLSRRARANAAEQLLTLAVILDRWRSENAAECEQWIKQAWVLRPLYDAVSDARGSTSK